MISHTFGEGTISYEFEITDENNSPINGLVKVQGKVAALTPKGLINNRDEADKNGVADNVHIGGAVTETTAGAVLTKIDDGHYKFEAPMKGVNASTEGIVWLRVGGNDGISTSKALVVNKPEGQFSTTTEACYACHIDYEASPLKHPSYTAQGMEGEVTFIEGCMVCHGSVSKAATNDEGFSIGGYSTNTLSKIGHVNHQKFTKDFSVMNCTSCHVESPTNTNFSGPGCIDCHGTSTTKPGDIIENNGTDWREIHEKKVGLTDLQAMRTKYRAETTTPVLVNMSNTIDPTKSGDHWCTTISLIQTDGTTETLANIGALYNKNGATTGAQHVDGKPVVYAGAYLHGYANKSIVGRYAGHGSAEIKTDNADGSRTHCFPITDAGKGYDAANIMASARVSLSYPGWTMDDSKQGVSFTAYSNTLNRTANKEEKYERRH
ncbi:MAG: multiheme c-type cytochrome, partial [Shewanella sp.]